MTKKLTRLQAIRELSTFDHAFLTPKGVATFTEPFGFKGETYKARDTRSQFKGLHVPSVNEGDEVEGQDAHIVALQIADRLGVPVPDMFGIGSQLAIACDLVEKHLIAAGDK